MKLMLIMVCDDDKERVNQSLVKAGFTPTLIASTGEFLQFGKSLILVGVKAEQIETVTKIVDNHTDTSHIKGGEVLKANLFVLNASMMQTHEL